ncbi:MAG TPA: hypothetical protein EYQ80_02795, partial [Candidatus Poseidoniales archaeon]|nr:hypothetical protein [Candidatus Poseidoniales archaeon]
MADEVTGSIGDIFAKEVDALQAAREELETAPPPEEPESVADAFEIGTTEPLPVLSPEPIFPSDVLR